MDDQSVLGDIIYTLGRAKYRGATATASLVPLVGFADLIVYGGKLYRDSDDSRWDRSPT